jgi:hypothetical protein
MSGFFAYKDRYKKYLMMAAFLPHVEPLITLSAVCKRIVFILIEPFFQTLNSFCDVSPFFYVEKGVIISSFSDLKIITVTVIYFHSLFGF